MAFSKEKRIHFISQVLTCLKYTKQKPAVIARKLNLSKQTVYNYIQYLIDHNYLYKDKQTATLKPKYSVETKIYLLSGLDESTVWSEFILPKVTEQKNNIIDILEYSFTEILNNAIDHSESKEVKIYFIEDFASIRIVIRDYGIGIFKKIQNSFHLNSANHAILELDKGKCTTDPEHHTGEGIFFSSKMFEWFCISANDLVYTAKNRLDNSLLFEGMNAYIEAENKHGTEVLMEIAKTSALTTQDIFDKFTSNETCSFDKTIVSVIHLIDRKNTKDMTLISRSQAKRLLIGFERFSKISLDFEGIDRIGQGFADEIFRVYKKSHPDITILYSQANDSVEKMIKHAQAQTF